MAGDLIGMPAAPMAPRTGTGIVVRVAIDRRERMLDIADPAVPLKDLDLALRSLGVDGLMRVVLVLLGRQ